VNVTLVDTENSFLGAKNAETIAKRLGAQYRSLPIQTWTRSPWQD